MMKSIFNIFPPRTHQKPAFSEEEYKKHHEEKLAAMEKVLGARIHSGGQEKARLPLGGSVDLYCFPDTSEGTCVATTRLIEPDGSGPLPNRVGTFELVAFTRRAISSSGNPETGVPFFLDVRRRVRGFLTIVSDYSFHATLNPLDTCEVPLDENEEDACLIFDEYKRQDAVFEINGEQHGLLLCMEVFRRELEYAMQKGTQALIELLKEKGHYPCSDLERDPVV